MAVKSLPSDFKQAGVIDLSKNKKQALGVNLLSLVIAILMFSAAWYAEPLSLALDLNTLIVALIFVVCLFAYTTLHELTHGLFFRYFSKQKVHYGLTGIYAYAKSDAYFKKGEYIIIGLAPVVLFFVVFGLLMVFLPQEYFWFVYFLQIFNISGAAGDIFMIFHLRKFSKNTLIHDDGAGMKLYEKTNGI
ncbi:MAG: DUF3267 domain-containing protein [Oscillospiraceae bacterium]|jgi:hypothetical protein|nr:DUF3267 domain-containing protein [Oscillospiraceae bacterium]